MLSASDIADAATLNGDVAGDLDIGGKAGQGFSRKVDFKSTGTPIAPYDMGRRRPCQRMFRLSVHESHGVFQIHRRANLDRFVRLPPRRDVIDAFVVGRKLEQFDRSFRPSLLRFDPDARTHMILRLVVEER